MPTFHYQAWDAERQPIAGELQADSVQDAISELEARGLTLQLIGYIPPEPEPAAVKRMATDANSAREVIQQKVLRAHLAKVLAGGKAIVPALEAFSKELPAGHRRNELHTLIRILERDDASEAEKAFSELPDYWIPLLSAATTSSDPGRILQEFIRESQRGDEIRRQWQFTVAYPILIACIASAVFILLSILVIPTFRDIFAGFNLQLPWLTSLNLTVAHWIAHTWPYVVVVFILVVGGFIYLLFRGPVRPFGVVSSPLALFGRTTAIARLTQFMADLLEAGLSVPDTLAVVGYLTKRKRLRQAVWRLADQPQLDTKGTKHLEAPARMAAVFHALRSEMPAQSRVRLLREIGQAHSEKVRHGLSWTRGVIEPFAIIAIGFVVGIIVVSLFLPLIKLVEGLSK